MGYPEDCWIGAFVNTVDPNSDEKPNCDLEVISIEYKDQRNYPYCKHFLFIILDKDLPPNTPLRAPYRLGKNSATRRLGFQKQVINTGSRKVAKSSSTSSSSSSQPPPPSSTPPPVSSSSSLVPTTTTPVSSSSISGAKLFHGFLHYRKPKPVAFRSNPPLVRAQTPIPTSTASSATSTSGLATGRTPPPHNIVLAAQSLVQIPTSTSSSATSTSGLATGRTPPPHNIVLAAQSLVQIPTSTSSSATSTSGLATVGSPPHHNIVQRPPPPRTTLQAIRDSLRTFLDSIVPRSAPGQSCFRAPRIKLVNTNGKFDRKDLLESNYSRTDIEDMVGMLAKAENDLDEIIG